MTSHAPPDALSTGVRVVMKLAGRWRDGTCIELRSEQRGNVSATVFRIRLYPKEEPTPKLDSRKNPGPELTY